MQSIWTGLSALNASTDWMGQISGNVANQGTDGYADTDSSFEDMLTSHLSPNATAPTVAGHYTEPGLWSGTGVINTQVESNFDGIGVQKTGNNLDFAVSGTNQFFTVQGQNGKVLYTKAGDFQLSENPDGTANLVTASGQNVLDTAGHSIVLPKGVTNITVNENGQISYGTTQGQTIAVANVGTPSQFLVSAGNNNYMLAQGGQATIENAQNSNSVQVMQGYLDTNNVDMTDELDNMIQAQNLYEANAKAISLENQMMQIDDKIHP